MKCVINGLSDGLKVIVLLALETNIPGKGHSEPEMGSSPYSFLSASYFKIESLTHTSQLAPYSLWMLLHRRFRGTFFGSLGTSGNIIIIVNIRLMLRLLSK